MSGRVADLGIGGRDGALSAVEVVNQQGGIGGRPLELLSRDDEQNDDTARRRLGELLDAGVAFVVGPMTSSVAVAVVPLANQRGVPLISPTATTHELTGKADMFFRLVSDAPTGARTQAAAVFARGLRRLTTVTDLKNRAYTQSWTGAAGAHFVAAGGTLSKAIEFEAAPGLKFSELAQQVIDSQCDVVVIAASAADSALLVQQIRKADKRVLVALSAWAGTEEFPQLGGQAVEGAIVAQYFDRSSAAPEYKAFVELFRKRFARDPGFPAVNAYDAVMFGVAGLRTSDSRDGLLAALKAIRQHQGLQRSIPIDEYGDTNAPLFLTEVKDGAFTALAPA